MGIPNPDHDPVLIREHMFHDLKESYLVLPQDTDSGAFRPIRETGLGLFEYRFGKDREVHWPTSNVVSWALKSFFMYFVLFASVALVGYLIYSVIFAKIRKPSPYSASMPDLESNSSSVSPLSDLDITSSPDMSPDRVYIKRTNLPETPPRYKIPSHRAIGVYDALKAQ